MVNSVEGTLALSSVSAFKELSLCSQQLTIKNVSCVENT